MIEIDKLKNYMRSLGKDDKYDENGKKINEHFCHR